jgi:hypothetical protein
MSDHKETAVTGTVNVGGFYPEASVNCLLTRLEFAGTKPSASLLDGHGNE